MDNINTGGLDWMVNEKEKDGHQFNEEKGKALKERPITHAESANNYGQTPKHITCAWNGILKHCCRCDLFSKQQST